MDRTTAARGRGEARGRRLLDWFAATPGRSWVGVFLVACCVYLLTAHYHSGQVDDTRAASFAAWHFVHHGSFFLDDRPDLIGTNPWFALLHGHVVVNRMMGVMLLGVPVCAALAWTPLGPAELNAVTAALMTGATVATLFLVFRRVAPLRAAVGATAVLAFGTSLWTVSAAETWPQTGDVLFLALTLLALLSGRQGLAGIALAPALLIRPHLAVVALVLGCAGAVRSRSVRPLLAFGLPAVGAMSLLAVWNEHMYGTVSVLGAYAGSKALLTATVPWNVWTNLAGTFVSPGQGLFLFTPVALLAVVAIVRRPRSLGWETGSALLGGLLYLVVQMKIDVYTGGGGFFGGRLVIEPMVLASPAALVAYQAWAVARPRLQFVASLAGAVGIAVYALGALLSYYLVGGALSQDWTSYYPSRVLRAAGPEGAAVAVPACCALALFALLTLQRHRGTKAPDDSLRKDQHSPVRA